MAASAERGDLVAVIGTGVSLALTGNRYSTLSWAGLISNGFEYAARKGKIEPAQVNRWSAQLASSDIDERLSAAEFAGRKLGAPHGDLYARWLHEAFGELEINNEQMKSALLAMVAARIPICTLNYDTLLEDITGLQTITSSETNRAAAWMRNEASGVFHLHGCWTSPESCILGVRDYQSTLGDDVRQLIQRALSSFRRLLFIGCGDTFADPNLSALINWLRRNLKAASPQHIALVPNQEVAVRHADPTWHGFVEPVGYGVSHDDLPHFLISTFGRPNTTRAKHDHVSPRTRVDGKGAEVIENYKKFLVRDCGQMTIEGVRADMDTAQRRFDLERLFVPLSLVPLPPEIPASDAARETKLREWDEEHTPVPFGKVFSENKALALLALPGGGKSLLLKRLAVAYADEKRRLASPDDLPKFDLLPILIRCREWREHIRLPIVTLLHKIPDLTAQIDLLGLGEALGPVLRSGKILLLIDGLDEIHDDADRTTFSENLERFVEEYKPQRIVVTSREAGFNLVAPCIARFCVRWRVAALSEQSIGALCEHWHRLMVGETPDVQQETKEVAGYLTKNGALRRLAENPLLLTMLLVVKHGAGRLPPDKVSLYSRAVEVLLDTWNIKGHDPLNPKEAVPQLAFVAFELMNAGKQTATEGELLALLEKARDDVPQIRLYAKDSPHQFLKRVELRSSLLLEAGHQVERGLTVPFYQFRHLTFQEYLAAVAVVEGHYRGYKRESTILEPLRAQLLADEWKEVVPMAAVLARKQAEPLIAELVDRALELKKALERGEKFPGYDKWSELYPAAKPAAVARLAQCLVEEVEAEPETLVSALQITAFFARGWDGQDELGALARGPYGDELLHQALSQYLTMCWPSETLLRSTCSYVAVCLKPPAHWGANEGRQEIRKYLASNQKEDKVRGLMVCAGFTPHGIRGDTFWPDDLKSKVEGYCFDSDPAIWSAAMSAWSSLCAVGLLGAQTSTKVLDLMIRLWEPSKVGDELQEVIGYAIATLFGSERGDWKPNLSQLQQEYLTKTFDKDVGIIEDLTRVVVAFHSRDLISDTLLAERLSDLFDISIRFHEETSAECMLRQMGAVGKKYIEKAKRRRQRRQREARREYERKKNSTL